MGQALRGVVMECMRSPVVCPYLIHYSPKARKRAQLDAKLHWNAVTTELPHQVLRPGAGRFEDRRNYAGRRAPHFSRDSRFRGLAV